MKQCHYCGCTKDLRPYGPDGTFVCFPCGTSPEHAKETQKNFDDQLVAAAKVSRFVIFDSENGPVPAESDPQFKELLPGLEKLVQEIQEQEQQLEEQKKPDDNRIIN